MGRAGGAWGVVGRSDLLMVVLLRMAVAVIAGRRGVQSAGEQDRVSG